ncbi:MAG TPA: hypothetical protein VFH56_02255 [Acidimicrobiales bacterium]|nr:hypothetical protein [Acidimicrobiales bacterium]
MRMTTKARAATKVVVFCTAAGAVTGLALPAAGAQTATSLAGFNLGATSAVVQFELNSPGLLPVGDPTVGNIFAVDVPLARTTAASGPNINALGSPVYPGDAGAHLGTAVETFGGPALPNDPVLAEADYPPTATNASTASFPPSGGPAAVPNIGSGPFSAGPATSKAVTSATGASVDSTIGDIGLGPPVGTATNLVHIQSAHATNAMQIGDSTVISKATSVATGIDIAGQIQVASVEGVAGGTSDGSNGTPSASLAIGKVTVGGQAAYIDKDGVHLANQSGGGPAVTVANGILANLANEGISVHTISPTEVTNGPVGSGDSGALVVTLTTSTPNVPGAGSLFPNAPPVPGAPSIPVVINLLIGNADASANASPLPTFNFNTLGGGSLGSTAAGTGSSGAGLTGVGGAAPSLAPTAVTIPPTGPGSSAPAARRFSAVLAGLGKPMSVGLIIGLLFLALCASGGMLGYARWQLIDGRRS